MTGDSKITASPDAKELMRQLRASLDALADSSTDCPTIDTGGVKKVEDAVEHLIQVFDGKAPLLYLKDKALVTDTPCRKVIACDRQQRRGRYPYYVRGFERETIDDYTLDSPCLLIGCLGTVETQRRRLIVIPSIGKGTPSELFHVVIPDNLDDFDYLYHALRATVAPPLLSGTDIVREIPRARLENVLLPWPDDCVRNAFTSAHTTLDVLSAKHDDRSIPAGTGTFELINAVRDALSSYYTSSTHHVEMLRRGFQVDRAASVATSVAAHEEAVPDTGDDSTAQLGNLDDPPRAILDLIEALIDVNASDDADILDVVFETPDLEHGRALRKADVCVCMPKPNPGDWTTAAFDTDDPRWIFGVPPRNKANFAWVMQTMGVLSSHGVGILLLCNGPLVSEVGVEKRLRRNLAQSGLVQCVISLPGGVFADGRSPTSIVILERGRTPASEVLFIDLQELGETVATTPARTIRIVPDSVVTRTVDTYLAWKNEVTGFRNAKRYEDIPGFCASVTMDVIEEMDGLLAPWVYT